MGLSLKGQSGHHFGPRSGTLSGTIVMVVILSWFFLGVSTAQAVPSDRIRNFTISNTEQGVALNWSEPASGDVSAYEVFRLDLRMNLFEMDEGTSTLARLPAGQTTFLDTGAEADRTYLYYVVVVEKGGGRGGVSVPLYGGAPDTSPPRVPVNVSVRSDAEGGVRISWNHPGDPDIAGFRVFRSQGSGGVPYQIAAVRSAPTEDQVFSDSVPENLGYTFAYSVAAEDLSGHLSRASEPVDYRPPDTQPPLPPVLTGLEAGEKGVLVHWSPSPDADLAGVNVYRMTGESASPPVRVNSAPVTDRSFLDTGTPGGERSTYFVTAVDRDGNESSRSREIAVRVRPENRRDIPVGLNWQARTGDGPLLVWSPTAGKSVRGYIVYRSNSLDGPFERISPLLIGPEFALDRSMSGTRMWYQVRTYYAGGNLSEASKSILWKPPDAAQSKREGL